MVSRKDPNSADLETVRMSKNPTTVIRASGLVLTRERGNIDRRNASWRHTGSSLTRKLCEEHGYTYQCTSGQKPHLIPNGWIIHRNTAKYALFSPPIIVRFFISFSPTSPTSAPQDTVTTMEHPATARREGVSLEWNFSHGPVETEKPIKNDDNEYLQSHQLENVPDWLQEFRHRLVGECSRILDASSSFLKLLSEPWAELVTGKHSIFTHFPMVRNFKMC